MTPTPLELLRLLSPPGRPAAASTAPRGAGNAGFAAMLARAQQGELSSGLPVRVAKGAKVMLTDEQLSRLAVAADRAQAQGATLALVLIDGLAIRLDVSMREVTGTADIKGGAVLTGIDAVISLPPAPGSATPVEAEAAPGVLGPPRTPIARPFIPPSREG